MRSLEITICAALAALVLSACPGGSGGTGNDGGANDGGFSGGPDGGCGRATCDALGVGCGTVSDGCGGSLDCGGCDGGQTCGGSGRPNLCGAPISSVPPVCNPGGYCWLNPLPTGNDLRAVFTAAPNDVWAAGAAGTLLHYDGTTWTGSTGNEGTSYNALWGSGRSNVYLAGGDPDGGVLLHFDGGSWGPVLRRPAPLTGLSGTAADNVWVVGRGGTALQFDGGTWGSRPPFVASSNYTSVWASGPDDVWIGNDNGEVEHLRNGFWSGSQYGIGVVYDKAWGSGPSNVWIASSQSGAVLRWDGGTVASAPAPEHGIGSLWGASANDVWAYGWLSQLQHFDGGAWTTLPDNGGIRADRMLSMHGTGAGDIWAGGERGNLAHYDGTAWRRRTVGDDGLSYTDVWVSGPNDVWIFGSSDRTVLRFDGTSWTRYPSGSPYYVAKAWGFGPNDVWAVGASTSHWDGTRWTHVADNDYFDTLYALWGANPNDLWAVGYIGTVKHWDGTQWTTNPSRLSNENLTGVWGSSASDVWIVGLDGVILRLQPGNTWARMTSPLAGDLYSVWGSSASDLWISGASGMLHWNGTTLSIVNDAPSGLHSLWGTGPADIWGSGGSGVYHYDGTRWSLVSVGASPPFSGWLLTVKGSPGAGLWLVGEQGWILHKAP